MIGTTLGHYRLLEKLGHGGMGEVYLAEDTKLKRKLALKVLSADLSGDQAGLDRFQREAESVAALNHPNIVTLYSVEKDGETRFLTMELVEGETLDRLIPEAGLPLDKVFDMAIPFADAMSTAHEQGIIHRDLKPANIMVTEDGRIKILDFGLAKLLDEPGGSAEHKATQALTQDGVVMGTVPYMAPEQVQGKELDRRSDIFSMGVILFEMATGSRPFSGETSADLISSILRDTPAPVTELKVDLPHHLGRIIRHCLEKDPKRRYQSALDIRNELADLKREVDSGVAHTETKAVAIPAAGKRPAWLLPIAVVALLAVVAFAAWRLLPSTGGAESAGSSAASVAEGPSQPSIAVMFFDNLSGDEELGWLRNGLTDMLVTDLSQSPDLRVLSTSRLYQILTDMKKLDERVTSFEVVQEVAREAGADTVILGTFAKLGETIRISIKIQEAATGEILEAHTASATVQDEIFARIDDLSRNIRQSIELPPSPVAVADRRLAEVSTQSVGAYRFYVEAEALHYQTKEPEAIELYKRAVELDPTFAMALAKLSTTHANLGMIGQSTEYAEKAIEHVDRLTEPERAYVEGRYYGRSLDTYGRAIDTYMATLEKYPHLTSLWNNVAGLYGTLWMHDEAIAAYEESIEQGDVFPGTYHGLAALYDAVGEPERAYALLDGFMEEYPDSFSTLAAYSGLLAARAELEAAEQALARAEELRPGFFQLHFVRYVVAILRDDWESAERHSAKVAELPYPFAQSIHLGLRVNLLLYQGRSAEATALVKPAIDAWPGPSVSRATSQMGAALGFYAFDEAQLALEHATAARDEAPGQNADFVGHMIQVLANEKLGNSEVADRLQQELTARVETVPGEVLRLLLHETRGHLALLRGDAANAVVEFEAAAAKLPASDANAPRILYALGEAYLAAEKPDQAEGSFRSLIELEGARAFSGRDFVRSHFQLARILEQQGDTASARQAYQKFLDYWAEGDMEREWVDIAQNFLTQS